MPRYVAFLRGVSPMNASMPELKRCFEAAGFSDVRTLLSSGNVAFTARSSSPESLARRAGKSMSAALERTFGTFVRPARHLQELVESDPYSGLDVPPNAKLIVTFLRQAPDPRPTLPIERDGARILRITAGEALACYLPGDKGPAFMRLLERTFGTDITTRTMDTVRKCAWA